MALYAVLSVSAPVPAVAVPTVGEEAVLPQP